MSNQYPIQNALNDLETAWKNVREAINGLYAAYSKHENNTDVFDLLFGRDGGSAGDLWDCESIEDLNTPIDNLQTVSLSLQDYLNDNDL